MGWSFDGWTKMRRIIWMVSNNRRVHANPKSKPVLPNIKGKFRTTCRNVHRIIWRKTTNSKKSSNRIPHSALRPPRLPACLVPMCRLRGNLENPNVIGQCRSILLLNWIFDSLIEELQATKSQQHLCKSRHIQPEDSRQGMDLCIL